MDDQSSGGSTATATMPLVTNDPVKYNGATTASIASSSSSPQPITQNSSSISHKIDSLVFNNNNQSSLPSSNGDIYQQQLYYQQQRLYPQFNPQSGYPQQPGLIKPQFTNGSMPSFPMPNQQAPYYYPQQQNQPFFNMYHQPFANQNGVAPSQAPQSNLLPPPPPPPPPPQSGHVNGPNSFYNINELLKPKQNTNTSTPPPASYNAANTPQITSSQSPNSNNTKTANGSSTTPAKNKKSKSEVNADIASKLLKQMKPNVAIDLSSNLN